MKCARSRWAKLFLCCALLLSLLTVTAFAAEEIDELTLSFISPNERPAVGEPIKYMSGGRLTETDDRIELTGNILLWCIDDSSTIINKTYDDTGMYYEAGRTYNAEIVVEVLNPEQYTIGENTKITLTNPGDFTYTSELSNIVDTGTSFFADMKLTITMNGARTYPDITKVLFKDLASPTDGMSVPESNTDIHYNNCMKTSGIWLGEVWGKDQFDNNTFVAGKTYTYRVVLTARDGYKFYENATIQLTSGGVDKAPSYYAYTNDNRTLTLDYTYTVPSVTWVEGIEAAITRYEFNLTPMAGNNCVLFDNTLAVYENAPYQVVGELGRTWYSEDGTELTSNDRFEAGKTYYFDYAYSIKDEYRHLYRFVPENLTTTITGESYTGEGFQKAERVEYSNSDNTFVKLRYYFTAQFPAGAGSSAGNPAMCYSYTEFKYAMENDDIRYVALGNVEEVIPGIDGDGLVPAISVNGIKNLNLLGDAVFSAPANSGYKTIVALLHTTSGDTLTVTGSGSLKFRAVASASYNAVIYNQGGRVIIDGGTLIGSFNTAVYGKAIWQDYGNLWISDGELFAENALAPGRLPGAATAVYISGGEAVISGGTFKTENKIDTIDLPYGLDIGQNADVELSGGTFHGIVVPNTSTMANYVKAGCTMRIDGSKAEPADHRTINGIVGICKEISKVNIYINSPVEGEYIPVSVGDVYFAPEGCTVKRVTWLEDGEDPTTSQFIAGKTYTVEIALTTDDGVKFTDPLTSATINGKPATVKPQNSGAENGIILTVDLGTCSNTVSEVAVEIDAPGKGRTPDQTINMMTGGYVKSYKYGIQWQESTDGSNWRDMTTNDSFEIGKYYRVSINLAAADGYLFATDSNWDPTVSATVNGKSAEVFRYPEESPDELIYLRYNFGILNDVYIPEIRINDIVEPKAGQKPSYTCTIGGNGYTINNANNNGTYVFNGICWKDVSDPNWEEFMGPNDTFVLGGVYTVIIDVKTLDDYEFSTNTIGGSYEATGTGWVNGEKADLGISMNDTLNKEQNVQYIFTCGAQEISTIILYNLDEPVGGKVPDTTVTAAYSEYYTVESVTWNDIEGGAVGATFETGVPYQATIVVKAQPAVYFSDAPSVYIDGKQPNSNNVTVSNEKDTVTIVYAFSKPAAAPEVEQNPILHWNGSACTIYPNSSGATMAASYVNGQLKEVVFFKNNTSVTLSGDSVKVFFLKTDTYAPVRNAIEE